MKHAKLENNNITFIGSTLKVGNVVYSNPTDQQYLSQGWKRYLEVHTPYPEDGGLSASLSVDIPSNYIPKEYEEQLTGYEQDTTTISALYGWHEVVAVKTYSKLKILLKLTQLGYWPQVKAMLNANVIDGTQTYYIELWDAAQVFKSDDKYFSEALDAVVELLGTTPEKIQRHLDDCIAD